MLDRLRRFRERFPFQAIVIEVFAIVLGVLFALYVKDWQETRENATLARMAIQNIRQEIHTNQESVEYMLRRHQEGYDSLQATREELTNAQDWIRTTGGIQYRTLYSARWELASETQALAYIDYDVSASISRLYKVQEFHRMLARNLSSIISSPPFFDEATFQSASTAAAVTLHDIILIEEDLLKGYDQVLRFLARTTEYATDTTVTVR